MTVGNANSAHKVTYVLEGAGPAIAVVDIDDDNDFDMFIGSNTDFDANGGVYKTGSIDYFKNVGTPTNPSFQQQIGTSNPFNGMAFNPLPNPTAVDVDKDGVWDMYIGTLNGDIQYFRNEGSKSEPLFVELPESNPATGIAVGFNAIPIPIDVDNDGIMELFVGTYNGDIRLYSLTHCQPASTCHGRGNCEFTSITESQCQCSGGAFHGHNCESCPAGTLEPKYLGGKNIEISLAPQCANCPAGYWSDVAGYDSGITSCKACASGYYFKPGITIGTTITDCISCEDGKYQKETGKTLCLECVPVFLLK